MGIILSRWRKQPSTIEVLEKLDKDIDALDKLKRSNLATQKKIIGALILYSVILYIASALIFYFYYMPDTWPKKLLYSSPLLAFGLIVWLVKRFLHWYFVKRINRNDDALVELKEKKKTILEEVMETETYKKAKEILEKFDPERFKKLEEPESSPAPQKAPDGQEIRQRQGPTPGPGTPVGRPTPQGGPGATPRLPPTARGGKLQMQRNGQQMMSPGPPPPGPPMARPVLPRERSVTDRMVEYLVGDGPQNRYALICTQCFSHNGMALKEEFEFICFRCCYCYTLNPARKHKPQAPSLQMSPRATRRQLPLNTTATESNEPGKQDVQRDKEMKAEEEDMEVGEDAPSLSTKKESLQGFSSASRHQGGEGIAQSKKEN